MPTAAEAVKTIEAEIERVARLHEDDEWCHNPSSPGWLYQHGKAESLRGILWWLQQHRDSLTAAPEPDQFCVHGAVRGCCLRCDSRYMGAFGIAR